LVVKEGKQVNGWRRQKFLGQMRDEGRVDQRRLDESGEHGAGRKTYAAWITNFISFTSWELNLIPVWRLWKRLQKGLGWKSMICFRQI
jgi:hypothetical protein